MEGESGEQVEDELESVTSSAEWFVHLHLPGGDSWAAN